jgi:hypothetical protein
MEKSNLQEASQNKKIKVLSCLVQTWGKGTQNLNAVFSFLSI